MIVQKDFFGQEHTIEPITLDDIPAHYELVKEHVACKANYVKRMKMCVEAGTAYKIDNDAFIYYHHYFERRLADAYCIYGGAKLIPLLIGVFTQVDPETFCLRMGPHKPGWHKQYRSIMTKTSLGQRRPLVCRLDELFAHYKKFKRARAWES
jgi:hypothetical protein